ncbi:MAG: SAM-dependent methyltransferase [Bacteroidetes bacterium]|nr:SAM-dependent methyltransferase [Bacteroidota bacterium]
MSSSEKDTFSFIVDHGSFRDPSGFSFYYNNEIFRAIAPSYFDHFELMKSSGLYDLLSSHEYLVKHNEEVDPPFLQNANSSLASQFAGFKIIKPKQIPFISYPYEWCFSQLKKAALLTLTIQSEALKHGMTLKDASAFNVQFIGNKPIFIDTLSFEKYKEGSPWIAYRQFCQHFLAPLALIAYKSESLSKLSQVFLDGIPLELTSSLLTMRSYLNTGIASHIHVHSKIQPKKTKKKSSDKRIMLSKRQLTTILDHLKETVNSLNLKTKRSLWNEYVSESSYTKKSTEEKSKIISGWLQSVKPKTIWDMGSNTGTYSLLASAFCNHVIAMDADHACMESFCHSLTNSKKNNILPLIIDLANPSPGIGWNNRERKTLIQRGKPDLIMALALVHHLRISHGIPFEKIARSFSEQGEWLIIEYVPKDDSQVEEMLQNREDIFTDYIFHRFIDIFSVYFDLHHQHELPESKRILCLMRAKKYNYKIA